MEKVFTIAKPFNPNGKHHLTELRYNRLRMSAPIDITQHLTPKQTRFLRCFEASASVTLAARWAKIQRQTHYLWMEIPLYAQAFAKAEKVAAQTLEDEAVRRAHQGVKKTIRYKGKVVGVEHEYSDTLMVLLLKGGLPKKYRDNSSVELTGKDGKPLFGLTQADEIISDGDSSNT